MDIQPRTVPSCAPAMPRAARDSGPESAFASSWSRTGSRRRRNDPRFVCTQPARSTTLARAGPEAGLSPVSCTTIDSASTVSSAKSFSSWAFVAGSRLAEADEEAKGFLDPTHVATLTEPRPRRQGWSPAQCRENRDPVPKTSRTPRPSTPQSD